MSIRFFPKVVRFFDLFERQNALLKEAATLLHAIFNDFSDVPERCGRINDLETEGDRLSREIAAQLSLTFITPLDREDIHAINMAQEDLLNAIRAISSRIGLYRFDKPEQAAVDLVDNLRMIVGEIEQMLRLLSHRKDEEGPSQRVHTLKNDADMQLLVVLGELYEAVPSEKGLLRLIQWTQIYDRIEQALERAEALANVVEGVHIKNA